MKLITGKHEETAAWITRRIPYLRGASLGPCVAFAVADDHGTKILGAVAFHGYRPQFRSIEWTAASDTANWLSVSIINQIMRYPFEQLDCARITAYIAKKNIRSREFQVRFGFKHEGTLRRQFGRDDCCVFGLLQSEWRKSRFNLKREAPQVQSQTLAMVN